MHQNLERRFLNLCTKYGAYQVALGSFKSRFHLLFAALAEDLGKTGLELGKLMGWDPVPLGGNAIMNGEAEPSNCDIFRLLGIWEESQCAKK